MKRVDERVVDGRGTVPVFVRLEPDVAERLGELVESTGGTMKSVITELVRGAAVIETFGPMKRLTVTVPQSRLSGVDLDEQR